MPKEKQEKKQTRETWVNKIHFLLGYDVRIYIYTHREKHTYYTTQASFCFSRYRIVIRNSFLSQQVPDTNVKIETFMEVIYCKNTALLQAYSTKAPTLRKLQIFYY